MFEPSRTALLVMDFQADVLKMFGDKATPIVDRVAGVIAAARTAKIQIIHIVVGFRPGYPEVSARNASFTRVTSTGAFIVTTPGADIAPALRPEPGDLVVVKHRVSAFTGTDLEMILRAKGIDTLVLCGLATSGVVLSTIRHAADADYSVVVVKDGCGDGDEEVHRVLTEKLFVRQGTVMTASEAISACA